MWILESWKQDKIIIIKFFNKVKISKHQYFKYLYIDVFKKFLPHVYN